MAWFRAPKSGALSERATLRRGSRRGSGRGLAVGLIGLALTFNAMADPLVGSAKGVTAAPTVTANSPIEGTVGTQVTITGTNLKRGTAPVVQLKKTGTASAIKLAVNLVTPTQVTATVKGALKPGVYQVWIKWGRKIKLQAPSALTIQPPALVDVSPEVGGLGATITVHAAFLGLAPGTVTVDAKKATIASWLGTSDTNPGTALFKVPAGLANGYHSLTIANGVGSASFDNGLIVVGQPDTSGTELRLSNAASTSNTQILVQFSKPVDPRKAELPDHYRITSQVGASNVTVVSAEVERPSLTTVKLTTLPQSEIAYNLKVTDIVDLAGNPIAAPSGTLPSDPSATTFRGIGPGVTGQQDTDGDGITDADEQRGYTITIVHTDGTTEQRFVTSDPADADTDNDGVTDDQEKHAGSDPRSPDTDGDTLSDNMEWNVLLSNPADQDTDNDGIQDGYEYCCLGTSPLLADTDGDQISDGDEVFARNRNPLVADLPAESISVGDVRLQLDQRFTYQDDTGHTVSTTDSAQSTLETDTSHTTTSNESLSLGGSFWAEGGLRDGTDNSGPFFRAHGEFNVNHTSDFTDESVQTTQQAYQTSLEKASELSTTSTVTREVVGASIGADVTIENKGNVAFSISSIQITVSERDPESTFRLIPVATLTATGSGDTTFHLGPFNTTRGPILFSSQDVFPNLVEALMKNPGSLVFTVANFDMTDELGRHFTYADQIARDRTGGIFIDSGDSDVRSYLIATSLQSDPDHIGGGDYVGGFNANGSPIGLPLDFALQHVLGWKKNATTPDGIITTDQQAYSRAHGDDIQEIPPGTTGVPLGSVVVSAGPNGVLDSTPSGNDQAAVTTGYETQVNGGVEQLVRVGSLRNGDLSRQWVVGTTEDKPASADFGTLMLMPGQNFYLAFVQDLDQDGLYAREELLAGSTDSVSDVYDNSTFGLIDNALTNPVLRDPVATPDGIADSKDTDHDGLGDYAEVRVGWKVSADGGALNQVFSSPRLPDSDGDGLLDPQEQNLSAFCQPNDPRKDALCTFQSAATVTRNDAIAIIAGANGKADSQLAGDDVRLVPQGATGLTYAARVIGPGHNGVIDTLLGGDDLYMSTASARRVAPATDPGLVDTDADGVSDFEELTGFKVGVAIRDGGSPCGTCRGTSDSRAIGDDVQQARFSGPVFAGGIVVLPGPNGTIESTPGGDDVVSAGHNVVTDPLRRDTDSDLVTDGRERTTGGDPTNPLDATEFKDSDQDGLTDSEESILGWFVTANGGSPYLVLSNPSRPDSDGDGLPDLAERMIGTDPNKADTDGDGLTDFNELGDFTQFQGLDDGNPGFVVNGANSKQYGTNPLSQDTDGDGLTDKQEVVTGYYMLVSGEAQPRWIHTNPTRPDTDSDGMNDYFEMHHLDYETGLLAPTDATDSDTDDDGRKDGIEVSFAVNTDPLVKDVSATVLFGTLSLNKITDVGGTAEAEVIWFYTVTPPSGSRVLVSDAWDASNNVNPGINYYLPDNVSCHEVEAQPTYYYTLSLNKSYTMRLKPGDSFTMQGILFEGDPPAAPDCGTYPNYIPSWVNSGCVTRFSQVFSYEDFDAGGKANVQFPTGQGTAENCDWTQEIYVTAR